MTPEQRNKLIRLAYHSRDPELRRRAVNRLRTAGSDEDRLPKQPWSVMQDAREEGIIAEEEKEDGDVEPVSLFDEPADVKSASLNSEDRELIRIAHATRCPGLRRRVLGALGHTKS